jgi:hypothetical protein
MGIGAVLGSLTPVAIFLFATALQFLIQICPTSALDLVNLLRKAKKCLILIPNAAIIGSISGLVYFIV